MDIERLTLKRDTYLKMATQISQLGTCKRLKVGAVMLREDGSLATAGYNGAPPGMDHCTDATCNAENRCIHTIHAEDNALSFVEGPLYTAFLTHEPCLNCTRMMARRGIKYIYFIAPYTSIAPLEKMECGAILQHFQIALLPSTDSMRWGH